MLTHELFEPQRSEGLSDQAGRVRPAPRSVEDQLRDWIVTDPAELERAPAKALETARAGAGDCAIELAHHPQYGWAVIWSWPLGERAHQLIRIQLHPDAARRPRHGAYPLPPAEDDATA